MLYTEMVKRSIRCDMSIMWDFVPYIYNLEYLGVVESLLE